MHEYTGNVKDPQQYYEIEMTDDEVIESVKKMLDESITECSKTGLRPFYASNKPPTVKILTLCLLIRLRFNTCANNPLF